MKRKTRFQLADSSQNSFCWCELTACSSPAKSLPAPPHFLLGEVTEQRRGWVFPGPILPGSPPAHLAPDTSLLRANIQAQPVTENTQKGGLDEGSPGSGADHSNVKFT